MKTIITAFVTLLGALCQAQTTVINRVDMSHGSRPYYTTGLVFPNGLEVWGFGFNQHETMDLEVGYTLYSKGTWTFAGYAAYWPSTKQSFLMPWVTYSSPAAAGRLTLNLAEYVPITSGPHILFSDSSRWTWKLNDRGLSGGLALQYGSDQLRAGLHISLERSGATYTLRALPAGNGLPGSLRFEVRRRF